MLSSHVSFGLIGTTQEVKRVVGIVNKTAISVAEKHEGVVFLARASL